MSTFDRDIGIRAADASIMPRITCPDTIAPRITSGERDRPWQPAASPDRFPLELVLSAA